MVVSLPVCIAKNGEEPKLGKWNSCLTRLQREVSSQLHLWAEALQMCVVSEGNCLWEAKCFLEIHLFLLSPLMGGCSAYCRLLNSPTVTMHADRVCFEREQNRVSGFLIKGHFLFEDRAYGKSISSSKSLARLPIKTFHESSPSSWKA